MQREERYPEDYDPRSRPGSRRNSASLSRRSSLTKERERQKSPPSDCPSLSRRSSLKTEVSRKGSVKEKITDLTHSRRSSVSKEKDKKKSPLHTAPNSCHSTPKKVAKPQPDFMVTGKQILKRSDRANSLPGSYHRRASADSIKKRTDAKRPVVNSQSSRSRETSLEDDMSLDLSQVSDFEDSNSKYGVENKLMPLATSTPKSPKSVPKNFQKARSASLQSQIHFQKMEASRRGQKEARSTSTFSCSRDSLFRTSSSSNNFTNRYPPSTELDYSSVSPEYSGQSSVDLSPRVSTLRDVSPRSQEMMLSSCCISSYQDCSGEQTVADGEWSTFWANYNNSIAKVPMKNYYDQCPTPYRTENIDLADLEFSESPRKRSPDDIRNVNYIIRNEGLHLTPRETQNIIKCAHILGNVLTKAIERRSKEKEEEIEEKIQELNESNGSCTEKDLEVEIKKKNLTLNLKETAIPLEVKEEKRCETVTTQTDISLPNTKTAPKIFEKILRQLSKSTLEENLEKNLKLEVVKKEEMENIKKED